MMSEEKIYLGKGTQIKDFDMIDITLEFDQLEQHAFEYQGNRYLKFTVSRMKKKSKYDATHTVYIKPFSPEEE